MNTKLIWRSNEVPEELWDLLRTLEVEYPVSESGRGLKLKFKRITTNDTVSNVLRTRGEVLVEYSTISAAARGVGTALAGLTGKETTPFRSLGIMLDVSRGMVMKPEHLKKWFRRLALSGYNMVMLYTEDVYELPDEPFFGYMRGAYSMEDIQDLDVYAAKLGIEMVGCIETLGHLEQLLRWRNAYGNITDTPDVLLVDKPETCQLVEKMIRFWSKALRSRRIHIGMDETQSLGRGRFLNQNGYENPFELFNRHLERVHALCLQNGLSPMIWSDMYFRFSNPEHEYYNWQTPIPKSVQERIPRSVSMVYWDYYHKETAPYESMIARHRSIGFDPIMASGIWTWSRLWYDHNQTMETAVPCIAACRKMKVQELFFTMWGDDGAFCNYDSALAGIIRCADLAFGVSSSDPEPSHDRFSAICMANYDAVTAAGAINRTVDGKEFVPVGLIWDDPLKGIYYDECHRDFGPDFALNVIDLYEGMLLDLLPFQEEKTAGDFEHLTNILSLVIKKLEFRGLLLEAYSRKDRIALRQLAVSVIPGVITAMEEFSRTFREQWLACAKPFGLEKIQERNAAQLIRLQETAVRLREYLDGQIDQIDELEKCNRKI